MRIGFDIGPITHARSGVGNYCLHLLKALLEIDELDISGFAASARKLDLAALGRPLRHRHLPVPTRVMYQVWSALGMPAVDGLLGGVDVYHATNYFLPPCKRAKRVLTIHDIAFKKHPELCSPKIVGPFSSKVAGFAREADAVIADSESTRQDIIDLLGVNAERVHTVHLGAETCMRPMTQDEAVARVGSSFSIGTPYVLFVGTIEARKNVAGLIRAFRQIQDRFPHKLVIVGARGWILEDLTELVDAELAAHTDHRGHSSRNRIELPGFVSQGDLPALYGAADALIFPSFYEGFGLPVLEAMACGCPVITANNSSLPEVGGDAAEYCDANDVDSIANAMRRVLGDAALREQMIRRGFAQAAKFSWKKTAEQTAAVYRSVCG
jgi:glycosyltransferase involved in cell wall biosynthesis